MYFWNEQDDICSSGTVSTQGGDSASGDAGRGGKIRVYVGTEGYTGNLTMSGVLNSSGGNSAKWGKGGDGGDIKLRALIGNITLTGYILADGGLPTIRSATPATVATS